MKAKTIKTLRDLARNCLDQAAALSGQINKQVSAATAENAHGVADMLHKADEELNGAIASLSKAAKTLERAGNDVKKAGG